MNKLLILCCINIFSVIYAAPFKSDATINDFLQQLEFLKKCPTILNNNIKIHTSNGGLSHCKNVSINNPQEKIDLTNINEFYCIGLLAADIQLCSEKKVNKLPKNYDDLKINIDLIKNEQPAKICNGLKKLKIFNESDNIAPLKKWLDVLDKDIHGPPCVRVCTDIESGNTNVMCSMLYYINNDISYVKIAEKKEIPHPPKVDASIVTTIKDNPPAKVTTSSIIKENLPNPALNVNAVEKSNAIKSGVSGLLDLISPNKNDNKTPVPIKVDTVKQPNTVVASDITPVPVNKQEPEAAVDKPQSQPQLQKNVEPVIELTTVKQIQLIPAKKESVAESAPVKNVVETVQVKNVAETTQAKNEHIAISEQGKQPPVENPVANVPVVDDNQKVPTNVESSTASSTVSGLRDEMPDDYFDEMEDINKDNEALLISQTNARKEKIEILPNDEDRHNIPTDDDDDMEDSNFFSYFMFISVLFIAGYVVYHNKQKIMALLLEGRRDRNSRRRPNTASYRKLNSNLEEAVTSKCSGSASHVIY